VSDRPDPRMRPESGTEDRRPMFLSRRPPVKGELLEVLVMGWGCLHRRDPFLEQPSPICETALQLHVTELVDRPHPPQHAPLLVGVCQEGHQLPRQPAPPC
jgi:hypothetical protein